MNAIPDETAPQTAVKMKLFQYWDKPEPPPEVATWIDGFRTRNRDFDHVLFDEQSATDFIARHYVQREVAAFQACTVLVSSCTPPEPRSW